MEWDFTRALLAVVLGAVLVSAGVEDARTRLIADWKSIVVAGLAPLWWWANGASVWPGAPVQLAIGLVVFALFAGAFAAGMMGGGDVKLVSALALWLPPLALVDMLLAMAIAGGAVTAAMLVQRRMRRAAGQVEVPYGVAIAAAGLLSIGEPILNHFG